VFLSLGVLLLLLLIFWLPSHFLTAVLTFWLLHLAIFL
jgi:hypothetical protein